MTGFASLLRSTTGSAAAEMALVTPFLLILLIGSVELGKYFRDEHIVVEAVRDGARYAARQQMTNFADAATGCQTTPLGTVEDDTKKIVRTGNMAGTGSRLSYWTSDATITVDVSCSTTADGEDMGGIYSGLTAGGSAIGAPVVTVSASVPYTPLFGTYAFADSLTLNAQQQAAVTGQ